LIICHEGDAMKKRLVMVMLGLLCLAAGMNGKAQSIPELLEQGIYTQEVVGDLQGAVAIYQRILADREAARPLIAETYYRLAACYAEQSKHKEALNALETLFRNYSDQKAIVAKAQSAAVIIRAAMSEEEIQPIVQQAVAVLSSCKEDDPRVAEALASLAGLDDEKVMKVLLPFMNSDQAPIRRAAIFIVWKGEFMLMDLVVPQLKNLCSHGEDLTRGMAAIALGTHRIESSFDVLAKMTADDPSGYARRCAAYALGALGLEAARPILERASADSDPLVIANARAALKALSDPTSDAAKLASEKLTRKGFEIYNASKELTNNAIRLEKLGQAEGLLAAATQKDAENVMAWVWLGLTQLNELYILHAKDSFEKALALRPDHPLASQGLAYVERFQGHTTEAIALFKQVLTFDQLPDDLQGWLGPGDLKGMRTESLRRLAEIYLNLGDMENARTYAQMWWKTGVMSDEAAQMLEKAGGRVSDKTDYPFVDDPALLGQWTSVDFVKDISLFDPAHMNPQGMNLALKEIAFRPEGKTSQAWTWTKGLLLHAGDKTAGRYEIKMIHGQEYMFLEWKSGDYTYGGMKPAYYVLKKTSERR
jgi:tetratricopeptide (TPR) repeat protein